MNWRDLLQVEGETLVAPWTGGRSLQGADARTWFITGPEPDELGWYRFNLQGRNARVVGPVPAEPGVLAFTVKGYLVGDRVVLDGARVAPDPRDIIRNSEPVYFVEDGLDRFVRITAGRVHAAGPLIYKGPDMPLGPEEDVLDAYLSRKATLESIPSVTPALDAAFRMESHQRAEVERRRAEAEKKRYEEQARRRTEQRRREIVEQLGDGASRRAMARCDFEEAARAALAVGGAELLDVRRSRQHGERIVRFRLDGRRFECTCHEQTLGILDAGICLTSHDDASEFAFGTRGDTWFTLESLPSVIRQARAEGKLVVFRHLD